MIVNIPSNQKHDFIQFCTNYKIKCDLQTEVPEINNSVFWVQDENQFNLGIQFGSWLTKQNFCNVVIKTFLTS